MTSTENEIQIALETTLRTGVVEGRIVIPADAQGYYEGILSITEIKN